MEIRIGIQQSVRELMVEIDDEKAQAKAKTAAEAALPARRKCFHWSTIADAK